MYQFCTLWSPETWPKLTQQLYLDFLNGYSSKMLHYVYQILLPKRGVVYLNTEMKGEDNEQRSI